MIETNIVDHLFRHEYGKMVAILTRIFGLSNLQLVEDAVQDTFIIAVKKWRNEIPENPQAWLKKAAKNRVIDLLRKLKSDKERINKITYGSSAIAINELFLDHEIEDRQLRMIFTACHPSLNPKDQIAFALKTISGFSIKEISSALLIKEETVKKRLSRARKSIFENEIKFNLPSQKDIEIRLNRVLEIIYLIFNEGFHSGNKENLVNKDLCGEAIRLCKLILKNSIYRNGAGYCLFGLMCYHSSRLDSKLNEENEIVSLKNQDRSKWYGPLIELGENALSTSVEYEDFSTYHIEAAIAREHIISASFDQTNWEKIFDLYEKLNTIHPTASTVLNMAIVQLQLSNNPKAFEILKKLDPQNLEQRAYLYYGTLAKYYNAIGLPKKAKENYDKALAVVSNASERKFILRQKSLIT